MDGIYDWNVYARELPSVHSENHHPLMLNIIALKREGFESSDSSDFKNFQVRFRARNFGCNYFVIINAWLCCVDMFVLISETGVQWWFLMS